MRTRTLLARLCCLLAMGASLTVLAADDSSSNENKARIRRRASPSINPCRCPRA
ncbi:MULTISPECIES: hypothetical protein [Pseudomonas]|uniref:hypothetical protein n=1 Tax=Pseudomonas nitroreducens TaxID=46680 RepID=UPI001480D316|nr:MULTISPECIES: hypothetical protein [Pseudomonas]NNN23377.1 hypothetical protein [Pseudomonas nitroreducens]